MSGVESLNDSVSSSSSNADLERREPLAGDMLELSLQSLVVRVVFLSTGAILVMGRRDAPKEQLACPRDIYPCRQDVQTTSR